MNGWVLRTAWECYERALQDVAFQCRMAVRRGGELPYEEVARLERAERTLRRALDRQPRTRWGLGPRVTTVDGAVENAKCGQPRELAESIVTTATPPPSA